MSNSYTYSDTRTATHTFMYLDQAWQDTDGHWLIIEFDGMLSHNVAGIHPTRLFLFNHAYPFRSATVVAVYHLVRATLEISLSQYNILL